MPDFISNYLHDHQTTVLIVLAVLVIGAWIVFKIIKRTIMLGLAALLTVGALGGGAFYWWPN